MINTKMTVPEIIQEYKKDYQELIRQRFFGYIRANRKSIISAQKSAERKGEKGDEIWIKCDGVRRVTTSRKNKYRAILKARYRGENPGFMSTTYLILLDWNTGAKVVYLLPASDDDKGLILFTPRFVNEFAEKTGITGECFEDLVDAFMRTEKYFTLYQGNQGDPKYNCQVDMGSGKIGFGTFSEEDTIFKVNRFFLDSEIEEMRVARGLDSHDPLTVFLASREKETKNLEGSQEKSEKQKEIDAAWAEFENLKYQQTYETQPTSEEYN